MVQPEATSSTSTAAGDEPRASQQETPYIGSRISLISNSEIRYEGILYTVNTNDSTIALAKVKSHGTEDRPTAQPVAAHSETFEFIIFKASDIKDLMVCETPKQAPEVRLGIPPLPKNWKDPAIVSMSEGRVPSAPTVSQSYTSMHKDGAQTTTSKTASVSPPPGIVSRSMNAVDRAAAGSDQLRASNRSSINGGSNDWRSNSGANVSGSNYRFNNQYNHNNNYGSGRSNNMRGQFPLIRYQYNQSYRNSRSSAHNMPQPPSMMYPYGNMSFGRAGLLPPIPPLISPLPPHSYLPMPPMPPQWPLYFHQQRQGYLQYRAGNQRHFHQRGPLPHPTQQQRSYGSSQMSRRGLNPNAASFDADYDFEKANRQFVEALKTLNNEVTNMSEICDESRKTPDNVPTPTEGDNQSSANAQVANSDADQPKVHSPGSDKGLLAVSAAYDKSVSFFDNISSDAQQREDSSPSAPDHTGGGYGNHNPVHNNVGANNMTPAALGRRVNVETFGPDAVRAYQQWRRFGATSANNNAAGGGVQSMNPRRGHAIFYRAGGRGGATGYRQFGAMGAADHNNMTSAFYHQPQRRRGGVQGGYRLPPRAMRYLGNNFGRMSMAY